MEYIDLRSDTVTLPTPEMRKAMAQAPVGDDVYGDDPTVNRLEALAAQRVGKEAALFVPSGTFGNVVSILTHTGRGDEIITERGNHIVVYEVAAAAALAGAQYRTLTGHNGAMDPDEVAAAIRGENIHYPPTRLICVENAHTCGAVVPLENMEAIKAIAESHGISVHLDGARLFNAATALHVDPKELAAQCDSVMFCLSKGLCAPVGSILAGSADFIRKARKNRKMMGGGMRQAGILAAAGILALEKMVDRLQEDHDNAKYMADELEKLPGVTVNRECLDINMVFCHIANSDGIAAKLLEQGIKIGDPHGNQYRFVTSKDTSRENLDTVLRALTSLLQ